MSSQSMSQLEQKATKLMNLVYTMSTACSEVSTMWPQYQVIYDSIGYSLRLIRQSQGQVSGELLISYYSTLVDKWIEQMEEKSDLEREFFCGMDGELFQETSQAWDAILDKLDSN